jgi:hypothetical protein
MGSRHFNLRVSPVESSQGCLAGPVQRLGPEDADGGVKLICLGCKAAEVLTFEGARLCWQEQMRRDRVLALAGIVPDDLKRP